MTITWQDVRRERLHRHYLTHPAPRSKLLNVVGQVCGIHAQMASSAELSIGLRVDGLTRQHVRAALWNDRALIKTFGLRGTIHLFPTPELPLWLAALKARTPPRAVQNRDADLALPPDKRERVIAAMLDALVSGPLTREALGDELERRLGPWATERIFPAFGGHWPPWQLALAHTATDGLIAFGPNHGSRVSYVRLDQWLGPLARVDGEAALREVARRYFFAYGPATHEEFARWFLMHPGAARALVDELAADKTLEPVDVEGWPAWIAGGLPSRPRASRVRMVPHFDCFVVGCHPRTQLLGEELPPVMRKAPAANFSVVLVDGVVNGVWERRKRGKALELRVDTFVPLSDAQQAEVERDAQRIGEILESATELTFGHVEPRGHM
jgi:Winged helix DNA-binding domain